MADWTELCRVGNEIEAQLVVGYLDSQGIEADIRTSAYHPYPENLGMLNAVIVRVAAEDLARAQELLAELPQAEIDDVPELAEDPTDDRASGAARDASEPDPSDS